MPPPGGEIPRDSQGYLTGIVKDAAMDLAARAIPPVTRERRLRAIRRALAHAAELGVTSVQDMGPEPESIALYAELAERAELSARIYAVPPISRWEEHARIGVRRAFGSNLLRLGGLKGFSDGSLGSRTAYFHEPYTDAPSEFGLLAADMQPPGKMRDRMLAGDAAGLQLLIHAIGDRAVSMVLDLFAEVEAGNGRAERRWRIEHAQHLAPGDAARFARLGVIASVQPCHAVDDGRWAESRIGPERASRAFAFRTLLDGGVRLAIGTDWPVAPLDPMLTLWAACAREWHREQRITLEEALRACTSGAAYAEYQEREKGMLRPGMLADFVVLSEDIFELAPEEIRRVRVERTFLGGRQVWPAS